MSAEVEYYLLKRGGEKLLNSSIVKPGNLETSQFFGTRTKLVISCDIYSSSSTVMVLGKGRERKKIEATVWENEEDMDGREVKLREGRLTIKKPQELSLLLAERPRKKPAKQIIIGFSSSEDNIEEEVPQESRPLVLV